MMSNAHQSFDCCVSYHLITAHAAYHLPKRKSEWQSRRANVEVGDAAKSLQIAILPPLPSVLLSSIFSLHSRYHSVIIEGFSTTIYHHHQSPLPIHYLYPSLPPTFPPTNYCLGCAHIFPCLKLLVYSLFSEP